LERDGEVLPSPRGHKSWALLARVLRSDDPVSRQTLVDELFSEAEDPLGALRWTLAELRRRMGLPGALTGNPLSNNLGADVAVDIEGAARGSFGGLPPEGRFLEGIDVRDSALFDTWLLVERLRVDAEVLSGIREATLRALSRDDPQTAVTLARVMVRREPLDEGPHVLLIKALAASGDNDAAAAQVEASTALLERELGVTPTRALRDAARASVAAPLAGVSARTSAETLKAAGLAALSAGAADAGLECLRGAAAAASSAGETGLLSECLLEIGTAYVHSVHSHDDQGAVVLGSAAAAALDAGNRSVASRALAELGYIDVLAGRRVTATQHLERAREVAEDDAGLLATVASFEGANLHDWGRLEQAEEKFRESIENSRRSGKARREAWALGVGARTLFSLGKFEEAGQWAHRSNELSAAERWTVFRPWAEAWGARVDLALGRDPAEVKTILEGSFALSCHLSDACWEGITAQTLALACQANGEPEAAIDWLRTARRSCERVTDAYTWVTTEIALTEAEFARDRGDAAMARDMGERVATQAARLEMDGMLARAGTLLRDVQ
jgi:DNA-binding SARP family transcriptional activator